MQRFRLARHGSGSHGTGGGRGGCRCATDREREATALQGNLHRMPGVLGTALRRVRALPLPRERRRAQALEVRKTHLPRGGQHGPTQAPRPRPTATPSTPAAATERRQRRRKAGEAPAPPRQRPHRCTAGQARRRERRRTLLLRERRRQSPPPHQRQQPAHRTETARAAAIPEAWGVRQPIQQAGGGGCSSLCRQRQLHRLLALETLRRRRTLQAQGPHLRACKQSDKGDTP